MTTTDWIPVDTFGTRLYSVRRQLNLTVEEAAKRTGIPDATWSTWERGAKPRNMGGAVAKIALALGCSRDWLMWGGPLRTEEDPAMGSYPAVSLASPHRAA
jgi:transcriptional regulator with XRE-family HTH domain